MGTDTTSIIELLNQQSSTEFWLVVGTFAAVGVTVVGILISSWLQNRHTKLSALLEVFKLLNDEDARNYRKFLFMDLYYREHNEQSSRNPEQFDELAQKVRADFDQVGSLVREKLVPKNAFLRVYWDTTIRSWNALHTNVMNERNVRNNTTYMENFEWLNRKANEYKARHHPNESVEPYAPQRK